MIPLKRGKIRIMATSGDESIFFDVKKGTPIMIGSGEHAQIEPAGEEPISLAKIDRITNRDFFYDKVNGKVKSLLKRKKR